jgi:hypothetical protein
MGNLVVDTGTWYEEELLSVGETSFQLSQQPLTNAQRLSGYELEVFKNGVRQRHVASPTEQFEFHYNNESPDRTCTFVAASGSHYTFKYKVAP